MSDFGEQGGAASAAESQETLKFRETQPLEQVEQPQQQQDEGELQIVLKNEDDAGMAQGQIILPNLDPDSPEMAALLDRIRQGAMQVAEDGTIIITADSLKDIPGLQTVTQPEPEPREPMPDYDWEEGIINPETAEMETLEDDAFTAPEEDVTYDELFVSLWEDEEDENNDKKRLKVEFHNMDADRVDVSYVNIADKSRDEFVSFQPTRSENVFRLLDFDFLSIFFRRATTSRTSTKKT